MSTTTIRLPDDLKARLAAVSALVKGRADGLGALLNQREFCLSVITEAELRFGLARRVVNADLLHILESFLSYADIRPWACVCPSAGVDGAGLAEIWRPGQARGVTFLGLFGAMRYAHRRRSIVSVGRITLPLRMWLKYGRRQTRLDDRGRGTIRYGNLH